MFSTHFPPYLLGKCIGKQSLKMYCNFILCRVDDIDSVLNLVESCSLSISDVIIDDNRRRHVTILMSERGSWTTEASSSLGLRENKGKAVAYQNRLLKRSIKRSKSVINMFISSNSDSKELDQKAKNIKQVCVYLLHFYKTCSI